MKIAVYSQYYPGKSTICFEELVSILKRENAELLVESNFAEDYKNHLDGKFDLPSFVELDESFDLLISIGGDGTILRAITFIKDFSIPIVGINTGRLGFLATIQTDEVESAISDILNGNFNISERTLLSVKTNPANSKLQDINFALNEITLSRKNTTSMISVDTHLNGDFLTSYWADGLIVSTPTGSTGYSLSCGGPVITPTAKSLVLTPIAPHNLNARPLVIPDDTLIKLKVNGREDNYLMSLDSRIITLHNDTIVTIEKAHFKIKMVELLNENFLDTLRKKMLWGEDRRN
ncbi:MAG: NAD kinase [Bacteroidota bacterium]